MERVLFSGTRGVNKSTTPPVDRALADLAGRQHGRITPEQLDELGLKRSAVTRRVASGRLHRTHRGVYAVGHPVGTPEAARMDAVLACGPGAAIASNGGGSLGHPRSARTRIEVTVSSGRGRHLSGIHVHCSRTLDITDVTALRDVPCTTIARTLLDLADVLDRQALERTIDAAERLRLFDGHQVDDVLERANGRRGASVLRMILASYAEPPVVEGELERRFFERCERGPHRAARNAGADRAPGRRHCRRRLPLA